MKKVMTLTWLAMLLIMSIVAFLYKQYAGAPASASQPNYPNNLKCVGELYSTQNHIIRTYVDEEHKKLIYTIEDQISEGVSITTTDLK